MGCYASSVLLQNLYNQINRFSSQIIYCILKRILPIRSVLLHYHLTKKKINLKSKKHKAGKWSKQNFNSDRSCSKPTLKTVIYYSGKGSCLYWFPYQVSHIMEGGWLVIHSSPQHHLSECLMALLYRWALCFPEIRILLL